MFLKFRRVCEDSDEVNIQKRFKQDPYSNEEVSHIPAVLLNSDFCSLESNYLTFRNDFHQTEDLTQGRDNNGDNLSIETRTETPLSFEDMTLEQIGYSDFKENRDFIKHTLLSSMESNLDGSIKFIHFINPSIVSSFDFSKEEYFCHQISSTEMLKCVLNVLQGEESFLFKFDSETRSFFIALVRIPLHDTESTINLLKEFTNVGTKMKRLRDFTKRNILSFSGLHQTRLTPTMMSFSQSLDKALTFIKQKILKIPGKILETRKSHRREMFLESQLYTTHLSSLEVLSAARLEIFPEVNSLYEFCYFIVEQDQSLNQTSAQILSHMYIFLQRLSQLNDNQTILKIFFDSVKPFYHALNSFLMSGEAMDPCNEFFVEKSTFFNRGDSYVPIFITKYIKQIKEIGFMFSLLRLNHNDICTNKQVFIDKPDLTIEDVGCEIPSNFTLSSKQKSFEDIVKDSQIDIGEVFDKHHFIIENSIKTMNTKPIFLNDDFDFLKGNLEEMNVEDVINEIFCATIEKNYIRTGAAAIMTLNNEWHMRSHIQAIKRYLLMEAGDFSTELCERVFNFHSEFTDYQWILEEADRECPWIDEYRKNLSFVVSDDEKHPINTVKYFNFLSLTYTVGDGKGPLTRILFTRENMKKYELLWRFLLRIKRALFLLKETWITTKKAVPRSLLPDERTSSEGGMKKSRIILSSMDRLLKEVEMYFYNEGLSGPWITFVASLDSVLNVDALIRCHTEFLDEMLVRCFLTKKYMPISRIFTVLIDIVIKFTYVCEEDESQWKALNDKFRETTRTLYEILSKVNEGKTRYDLSLAQLLYVLECVCSK